MFGDDWILSSFDLKQFERVTQTLRLRVIIILEKQFPISRCVDIISDKIKLNVLKL
jgi:hypothetical protein